MQKILFDQQTGDIMALIKHDQDINAVSANWPNLNLAQLDVSEDFNLWNSYRRVNYRVDIQTNQIVPA